MVQSVSQYPLPYASPTRRTPALWRTLAAQDWLVFAYLTVLFVVTVLGAGPRRETALAGLAVDLGLFALGVGLARGGIVRGALGALAYRLGIFAGLFGSFLQLQFILPTATPHAIDAAIYAFDRSLFGFEPAEAFDRFVSPVTVEWFSFFYFGYYVVVGAHLFPFMFGTRDMRLLAEFSFGITTLLCIGHLLYLVVPGYGPYQHLASTFQNELEGPFFWRLVRTTVDAGEVRARTDIFPSLHTALPAYLAFLSIRHRRRPIFRRTWLPMTFFAVQIAISTMFLRWHYLVDVVAGLTLAATVALVAPRVARWEERRREHTKVGPVFGPLARR